MSKSRIKKPVAPPITSKEEAEVALGEIAKWQAKEQKLTGEMNVEIERVKRTYTEDIADLTGKIDTRFEAIKDWAEANKTLFKDPRSITTPHGSFGFRTGNFAVMKSDDWTWPKVIKKLVELATASKEKKDAGEEVDPASFSERIITYLKLKPDINKERLIEDRDTFKKEELVEQIGCWVECEETFFVEATLQTTETRLQDKESA